LPRRWRRALGLERGRLLLQAEADAVQLRVHDGDGVRDLARVPGLAAAGADALAALLSPELADLPRWLLLPAASGLRRRLSLPAAAAERLRDVVGFEIDRQTPFAAEAVAFDARLLGRRDSDGQLDAELVVVPRATLAAQSAALGALADNLAGVDVAGSDGAPLGVNLLSPAQRRQQRDPWRGWNRALAAVAVLAFAAMLVLVLDNRERAAQTLQARVEREAVAARAVALQRQQLADLVEGRAFLERRRSDRPTAVEVLDELARRLPDNTYLEKLAIENDRLLLIGLSGEASALVGRLEGAGPWRSPALTGALQPDPRSGRDRFTLTAELAVAPAAATPAAPENADAGPR
jgi:general secretion pathway protein L